MTTTQTKRFIITVFVFNVITAYTIYISVKPLKLLYPLQIPLKATLSILPKSISTTEIAKLVFILTNNTEFTFTDVKVIVPSIGMDMLETTSARRDTNLPWKSSDSMFSVENVKSGMTKIATISAFSSIPKTYTIRAWITTREGVTTTTNQETLHIE